MKILSICFFLAFTQFVDAQILWQRIYPSPPSIPAESFVIKNDNSTYAIIENRSDYGTGPLTLLTSVIRVIDVQGVILWESNVINKMGFAAVKAGNDFILITAGPSFKMYALKINGNTGQVIWETYIGDFENGNVSIIPSKVENGNYDIFFVTSIGGDLPFLVTVNGSDGVIVRSKKIAIPMFNYILGNPIQLPNNDYAIELFSQEGNGIAEKKFLRVFSPYGDSISSVQILGWKGDMGGSFYHEGVGIISHVGDSFSIVNSNGIKFYPDPTSLGYKNYYPLSRILYSKSNGEFLEVVNFNRTLPSTSYLDGAVKILRKKIDMSGNVELISSITIDAKAKDSVIKILSAVPTPDGGYLLAGSIRKISDNNTRSFIMRIGTSGDVVLGSVGKLKIYPNPAGKSCFVSTEQITLPETLRMYDATGNLLYSKLVTNNLQNISLEGLPVGLLICSMGKNIVKLVHF
jgi:hypothetical protein